LLVIEAKLDEALAKPAEPIKVKVPRR